VPREIRLHLRPAARVPLDEPAVDRAALLDALEQREEKRHVGPDVRLDVHVADVGRAEHAARVGGDAEAGQSELLERIDHDDLAAAPTQLHEARDEPRVVARGIRAGHEGEVGAIEILEHDRRGAGSVHLAQRHPGRGVAVVRAVVDVRAAPRPRDELEQERRLVARPPRHVEEGLVARGLRERIGGPRERFVPADAPEAVLARFGHDREGEPAEPLDPERRHPGQLVERRPREERLVDRRDHVAGLHLYRLLAHLGEAAHLVDHAAAGAAHAQGARLAGVA